MTVIMIAYNFMIIACVCSAEYLQMCAAIFDQLVNCSQNVCSADYLQMCAAIFDQLVNCSQNGIRYGFIRFAEGSLSFLGPLPCYPAPLVL